MSDAVECRKELLMLYVPARLVRDRSFTLDSRHLPHAYQTFKGKCLHNFPRQGLNCDRAHAHLREIVADAAHPIRSTLKLASRAYRLAVRLAGMPVWTLWKQCDTGVEIRKRAGQLALVEDYATRCPCGAKKLSSYSLAKVDAAQFFKNSSMQRGVHKMKMLLDRLRRLNFIGVAVRNSKTADGELVKHLGKKPGYRIILFDEMESLASLVAADDKFLVGQFVVRRRTGWPMGGSLSEPATLIDLGMEVEKWHTDPAKRQEIGWFCPSRPALKPGQLVAGLQHVDDTLLISRIF